MRAFKILIRLWMVKNYQVGEEAFSFKPEKSHPFKEISVINKAFTFYEAAGEGSFTSDFFKAAQLHQCDSGKTPYIYGHRNNPWHAVWHPNKESFDSKHIHLFKKDFEDLSVADVNCIFQQIAEFQKTSSLCENDRSCVMSEREVEKLLANFDEHHRNLIHKASDNIYKKVEEAYTLSTLAFVNGFFSMFIQRYVRPNLIDRGYDKKTIELTCTSLQTTVNYCCGISLAQAIFSAALGRISEYLLAKILDREVASTVGVYLNTVINTLQDPANIMFWLLNSYQAGFGMTLGEIAAQGLIRWLPKLRMDAPEALRERERQEEERPGLRRRAV